MRKNFKKIIVSSLAMVMVASTVSFTAPTILKKNIPATFGRVNVTVDGKNVTNQVEGFISNGTTYLPLRAVGNVFGYNVSWNSSTDMAVLNSSTNTNVAVLQQQLAMKDLEIARLNAELKKKENGSSSSSNNDRTIRDIESKLQKDYGDYEKIDFRIALRGDTRSVDLEIDVDLGSSREKERWDDLRERDIERLIEDMVRDIQKEYKNIDVDGYIRDKDAREDLYTFEKRGNRSIDIKMKSSSNNTRDMERDLERKYDRLKDVRNITFEVKEDRNNKFEIKAKVDYRTYESEWDKIALSEMLKYSRDAAEYIEDEYRNAKVETFEIVKERGGDRLFRYK